MMLRSIDVIQSEGKPLEWRLEGLTLRQINLVVGKNACGKTKALSAIRDMGRLIHGALSPAELDNVAYSAHFVDHGSPADTSYVLKIAGSHVVTETLAINGVERIQRGPDGAGRMWFEKQAEALDVQIPPDQVACASRRDTLQHPYLDELHRWGRASLHYRFNSLDLGKHTLMSLATPELTSDSWKKNRDKIRASTLPVQAVYKLGVDEFGEGFRSSLMSDMSRLDYPLSDIGIRAYRDIPPEMAETNADRELVCVFVTEDGIAEPIDQFAMSDGMFRAFSILVHVTRAAMGDKPTCVIIDDIGEGLDYERSCQLIKILIEKAEKTGIQVVMATNDRFIMNNVPLEYWTVLSRERTPRGTRIKVYNNETHKRIFDEFAYTGLNNFDFFATRFFEEGLGEPT